MLHSPDISIEVISQMPGLCVWKKDTQGRFLDMNDYFAHILGFNSPFDAYGKNDFDLPTGMSKFGDIFREADKNVMEQGRPFKFLEIQPFANEEWKAFYVIKTPYKENNNIKGTLGFAIEVTQLFSTYDSFLRTPGFITSTHTFLTNKSNQSILALSDRQKECLFLLKDGKTIKEIAKSLDISPRTVEDYLNAVKQKLDCRNLRHLMSKSPSLSEDVIGLTVLLQQQLSISIID